MITRLHAKGKVGSNAIVPSPLIRLGSLQRKCPCTGTPGTTGQCAVCTRKQLSRQRGVTDYAESTAIPAIVNEVLHTPGQPLDPHTCAFMESRFSQCVDDKSSYPIVPSIVGSRLTINPPDDVYEQEADRVVSQVMRNSPNSAPARAHSKLDFSHVRIHADARAGESARSVNAIAFTVGRDIVFSGGHYSPWTAAGQRLLVHELTHTIQQGQEGPAANGMIMRRWDEATSECASEPTNKWIERVVVEQETPQKVTVHWSDGSTDTDECSSGKGHCCVDPAAPTGIACDVSESTVTGANCTPITTQAGYRVRHRDLDHRGISFWTEFLPSPRYIALHQYSPVDGTPLSHGCVRLHESMAKKIFCAVRQNQTWVQVQGFARPSCEHGPLRREWEQDFAAGGQDVSQVDGDRDAVVRTREARKMLNAAYGRELTVDQIRALKADDIPRCTAAAPLPPGAQVGKPSHVGLGMLLGGLGGAGLGLVIGAAVGGLGGGIVGALLGGLVGLGLGALIGRA